MKADIESAQDLAKQSDIKYGTLFQGATYNFFKARPAFLLLFETRVLSALYLRLLENVSLIEILVLIGNWKQ